jgi:hypothetical protein
MVRQERKEARGMKKAAECEKAGRKRRGLDHEHVLRS